ncbi:MAG: hypothetical protein H8F28_21055 [Fibrella sp.]|nr:hypothetical protein [Armatimonadota bacterium]
MPNHLPPKNTVRPAPPTPRHDRTASLTALETGGLNALQRHFLLRHLAGCAECRAERERIALLSAGLRSLSSAPAPALLQVPTEPVPDTFRGPFSQFGGAFSLPKRVAVFAAVLVLSAGAVLTTLPGGPVRPTVAFARVEQAMDRVKTATWNERVYYPDDKAGRKPHDERSVWVRMDLPAVLSKVVPPEGATSAIWFLTTTRGVLAYSPGERHFFLWEHSPSKPGQILGARELRRNVRRSLMFPRDKREQGRDHGADVLFTWQQSPWTSRKVRRNGAEVLRFTRYSTRFRNDIPLGRKQKPQKFRETVYADPETFLLVRREVEKTDGEPGRSLEVSDGFRYNVALPSGDFRITAPVGKTLLLSDRTNTGVRAPVPPSDQRGARNAVHLLTAARNRNDWNAYANVRDFAFVPQKNVLIESSRGHVPAKYRGKRDPRLATTESGYRAEVRKNFRQGTPYRSWRIEGITHLSYDGTYLYTRRSASDAFPPTTPPDVFDVRARLTAITSTGKTETKGAFFTVRKSGTTFRVANVRYYYLPKTAPSPKRLR